ncbi:hypothetical protein NX794_07720 [Streptomyces sp. LP11]|uniref:Uncharacterized protein n=1 Tax=Streptomyces pyxinicus TaxID=2970331 RepID=A0ABT2AXY1_9ACTN|nr:hypothetical protein [Streptomyces sp. LP11]MCS0601118.1 hypothetical protein [Streptomyces sp. LP11]
MSFSTTLLRQTLQPLAGIFGDAVTADSTGPAFNCQQADEIALALYVTGHEGAAVTWLVGHTTEEEWDDLHAHPYDEKQGDADRTTPRVFTKDEIREYLREQSKDYLEALLIIAKS